MKAPTSWTRTAHASESERSLLPGGKDVNCRRGAAKDPLHKERLAAGKSILPPLDLQSHESSVLILSQTYARSCHAPCVVRLSLRAFQNRVSRRTFWKPVSLRTFQNRVSSLGAQAMTEKLLGTGSALQLQLQAVIAGSLACPSLGKPHQLDGMKLDETDRIGPAVSTHVGRRLGPAGQWLPASAVSGQASRWQQTRVQTPLVQMLPRVTRRMPNVSRAWKACRANLSEHVLH